MRPGKLKIVSLYAAICFIWGSTWLGIKLGLDGVPPLLGAGLRFTFASVLFFSLIVSKKIPLRLAREDFHLIAMVGGLNFGISYGGVYWSEQYISSGLASVLFCVYPFFVALLAHYGFHLEDLNLRKIAGIAVGFAGIVVIYADQVQTSVGSIKGLITLLVSTLGSSLSLVYLKKHGRELNTLILNFYSMLFGAGLLLLAAVLLERGQSVHWSQKNILALLYLTVFGSVIAFTIYFYLLKHLKATQMSFVTLIYPVLALLLGAWVLGERVSNRIVMGAALVLIGIFMASRSVRDLDVPAREIVEG